MPWDSNAPSEAAHIDLPEGVLVGRAAMPVNRSGDELLTVTTPGQITLRDSAGDEVFAPENPGGIEIVQAGSVVSESNPLSNDEIIRVGDEWVELIADVELNAVTTGVHSEPYDMRGYSGMSVHIYANSSGAPTHLRILPRFSPDYDGVMLPADAIWSASEEGLWASLGWEDTDTADGEWKTYYLPCAGQDWVMFSARGLGTTAVNVFRVRVIVRKFRGPHGVAHA